MDENIRSQENGKDAVHETSCGSYGRQRERNELPCKKLESFLNKINILTQYD